MSDDIEQELQAMNARLDAFKKRQEAIIELLIGRDRVLTEQEVTAHRNLLDELADLDEQTDSLERRAEAAIAEVSARSDGGEVTKKDIARKEARNELVRSAATSRNGESTITVSEIQKQARPQTELNYQTVKDAFYDLQARWECLSVDESGERRLVLDVEEISRQLVVTVEEDLGRNDLTKELISQREGEVVSA